MMVVVYSWEKEMTTLLRGNRKVCNEDTKFAESEVDNDFSLQCSNFVTTAPLN